MARELVETQKQERIRDFGGRPGTDIPSKEPLTPFNIQLLRPPLFYMMIIIPVNLIILHIHIYVYITYIIPLPSLPLLFLGFLLAVREFYV